MSSNAHRYVFRSSTKMSYFTWRMLPLIQNKSASSDPPVKTEPNAEEVVDLDSLQKGLAKAMVLQWKSDHPDESLDDIILAVTKGSYNEVLLEKGIDKTLYDQWRYVKYKQSAPTLVRPKKPIEINLPERRARQLLAQRLLQEFQESEKQTDHSENAEEKKIDKDLEKKEHLSCNKPLLNQISSVGEDTPPNKIVDLSATDSNVEPVVTELPKENLTCAESPTTTNKSANEGLPSQTEDAKDSLARIKKLLEQNKRTETTFEIPSISSSASAFIKDLQNFTATVPKSMGMVSSNILTENISKNSGSLVNSESPGNGTAAESTKEGSINSSQTLKNETPENQKIEENKLDAPVVLTKENKAGEGVQGDFMEDLQHGTKNVLDKWQNQPSEFAQKKKRLIVVVDEEEKENESLLEINHEIHQTTKVPDDLIEKGSTKQIMTQLLSNVDSELQTDKEKLDIEKGYTKQMLDKWKSQDVFGSSTSSRKRIEICEEDGSVAENEPVERSDVIKSDVIIDAPPVEKGLAKQLLSQWTNIPDYKVQSSKAPVVISDQDGSVAENEPIQREDVEREDGFLDPLQFVQKGTTQSLLNKWKTQNETEFRADPKKIIINEEDGRCLENEPVARDDVVRAVDIQEEELVEKGFTSLMLNKWQQTSNTPSPKSKTLVIIDDKDGVTAENEPETKADVARESDNIDHLAVVQQGTTRCLLGKWNNLQTETFKKDNKPVVISDSDGHVSENQPIERPDVVKAEETLESVPVKQGITKSLVSQWKNMKTDVVEVNKAAIKINEGDGLVAESEPITRTGVLKENDDVISTDVVKKGTTKALLNQWTTQKQSGPSKKEIVISQSDGHIAENQPATREDVVRESDIQLADLMVSKGTTQNLLKKWTTGANSAVKQDNEEAAEISKSVKGMTKKLLNQWTEKSDEAYVPSRKSITIEADAGCVAENVPIVRDNVVRSDESSFDLEIVRKGWAKNLTNQWNTGSLSTATKDESQEKKIIINEDGGCIAENDPSPKREDVVREDQRTEDQLPLKGQTSFLKQQLISRKHDTSVRKEPIKLCEDSRDEKIVAENEPLKRDDVAREEDVCEEIIHKRGFAKSMVGFWNKPQNNEQSKSKQAVIELAHGPSVFENNPTPSQHQHIKLVNSLLASSLLTMRIHVFKCSFPLGFRVWSFRE